MNPRTIFYAAAALVVVLAIPIARACFVCKASPMESVLVAEIEGSEDVVLARPLAGGGEGRFKISKIYKSRAELSPGTEVEAELPIFSEDGGKIGRGMVLLTRRDAEAGWIIRAPALLHQVAFYQRVLSIPKRDATQAREQVERTGFFTAYLHHQDPVLAKAAAAEVAEASYSTLKAMESKLDPKHLRAELRNAEVSNRRALFYTLLGICGGPVDAVTVNRALDSMWKSNGHTNLAALLTAKLELEGETAVDYIETRYFRDRDRIYPEVDAAIWALRVHGNAATSIKRERVIDAYRSLLEDRVPLTFLIAADLARWGDWESKDRLIAIADQRGGDLPEIREEVDAYLKACPK